MAKSNVFLLAAVLLATLAPLDTKKDVLFIAVDDLRPDLSFYGETIAKTPNLDALAAKSMIFERAYCQVATCSPSRTALLTGRRPDTNHVWIISPDEYWRMFTNATSIPQYFKENGYRSMGMGKIFHPGLPSGKDDGNYSWSYPYFHGHNKVSLKARNSWNSFENISDSDLRDGQIADKAIEYIQTINMNRTKGDMTPFFLAVGFHKPHLPFYAPSKYYDIYPPAEEIGLAKNPNAPNKMPPIAWAASGEMRNYADMHMFNLSECYDNATASMTGKQCHISDSVAHQLRRGYHACQTYTDAQIGRVLDEFQAKGLAKDAIIVLWGDHGWKLGEHNMWGKHTNLEDDTHVPFLLRVPGVTDGGMRTDALVELIDMFPTVTELAGLPVPPLCPADNKDMLTCVEGTSVAPLLKDPKQKWKKAVFSQYARPYDGLTKIPGRPPFNPDNMLEDVMGYGMRVDGYRFVEWYSFDRKGGKPDWSTVWGTELYDHNTHTKFFNDDNDNIAGDPAQKDLVEELRKVLQAGWRAAMPPGSRA